MISNFVSRRIGAEQMCNKQMSLFASVAQGRPMLDNTFIAGSHQ